MRIVFMGTPAIAAACLESLVDGGQEIVCVYTKPDAPKNRGMKLTTSEVKAAALRAGLPICQPKTLRDEAEIEALRALKPDLIAVVAYGQLLPKEVLEIPPLGCVNIHASLLPALRGAAPIQRAVLEGLPETGVTAMYMAEELDAGDMIAAKKTPIGPLETSGELTGRLTGLAAELLLETVRNIEAGRVVRIPQDASKATYADMLTKAMSPVDWTRSAKQIVNQVRGLHPWPVATAELGGRRFKLHRVIPVERNTNEVPGTLLALTKTGLEVACGGGGVVCVAELQAEGGKRMKTPDYYRGHPIEI